MDFVKYPKTLALEKVLPADANLDVIIGNNQQLIVEEKMDGTQVGLQFDAQAQPVLQSRGTIITSEAEFSWLKSWVWQHYQSFYDCLQQRYIVFGEWLWAKHTIFYDRLPHYWLEFDVYDRVRSTFLSTSARQQLFTGMDFIHSVCVMDSLKQSNLTELGSKIGKSAFISSQAYQQLDSQELAQTGTTGLMEGLYLKVEDEQQVIARYKLVRPEFIEQIVNKAEHWRQRPLVNNQIAQSL
jgi:hypothetical protein